MADFDPIWQMYMASGHPYVESQDRGQDLEPFDPDNSEDAAWVRAFQREHGGRPPAYEDYYDRLWSQQFAAGTGKTPDLNDYRIHYYVKYKGDDPERAAGRVSYETGKPVDPVRPTFFYQDRFGPENARMSGARSGSSAGGSGGGGASYGGAGGGGGSSAASAAKRSAVASGYTLPQSLWDPGAGITGLGAARTPPMLPDSLWDPEAGVTGLGGAGVGPPPFGLADSTWDTDAGVTGLSRPPAPVPYSGSSWYPDSLWSPTEGVAGVGPYSPSPWDTFGNAAGRFGGAVGNAAGGMAPWLTPGPWWRWLTER